MSVVNKTDSGNKVSDAMPDARSVDTSFAISEPLSKARGSKQKDPHFRSPKKFQPKRLHSTIKKEVVNPSDYLSYDFRFACEDCSHFDSVGERCTLGYQSSHHRKAQQIHDFELSGRMALCRFHEID